MTPVPESSRDRARQRFSAPLVAAACVLAVAAGWWSAGLLWSEHESWTRVAALPVLAIGIGALVLAVVARTGARGRRAVPEVAAVDARRLAPTTGPASSGRSHGPTARATDAPWLVVVRLLGPVRIDGLSIRRRVMLETLSAIALFSAAGGESVDLDRLATSLDVTRRTAARRVEAVAHRIEEVTGAPGLVIEGVAVRIRGDVLGSDAGRLRSVLSQSAPGPDISRQLDDALARITGLPFTDAVRSDDTTWPWLDREHWPHVVAAWVREGALLAARLHLDAGLPSAAERSLRSALLACPHDPELLEALDAVLSEAPIGRRSCRGSRVEQKNTLTRHFSHSRHVGGELAARSRRRRGQALRMIRGNATQRRSEPHVPNPDPVSRGWNPDRRRRRSRRCERLLADGPLRDVPARSPARAVSGSEWDRRRAARSRSKSSASPWWSDRWFDAAACQGWDTELFFPEARQSASPEVRSLCAACSVRQPCLDYALEHRLGGIWGGTSENQRKRMRRERAGDEGVVA